MSTQPLFSVKVCTKCNQEFKYKENNTCKDCIDKMITVMNERISDIHNIVTNRVKIESMIEDFLCDIYEYARQCKRVYNPHKSHEYRYAKYQRLQKRKEKQLAEALLKKLCTKLNPEETELPYVAMNFIKTCNLHHIPTLLAIELIKKHPNCAMCKLPFRWGSNTKYKAYDFALPSVDHILPEREYRYHKCNIMVVCLSCNVKKNAITTELSGIVHQLQKTAAENIDWSARFYKPKTLEAAQE